MPSRTQILEAIYGILFIYLALVLTSDYRDPVAIRALVGTPLLALGGRILVRFVIGGR